MIVRVSHERGVRYHQPWVALFPERAVVAQAHDHGPLRGGQALTGKVAAGDEGALQLTQALAGAQIAHEADEVASVRVQQRKPWGVPLTLGSIAVIAEHL